MPGSNSQFTRKGSPRKSCAWKVHILMAAGEQHQLQIRRFGDKSWDNPHMASESLDESWLNPLEEVSELPEFLMPCLIHNLIVPLIFPNPIVDQFLASSKLWLLKLYPQNHHSLIPNTMKFVCQLVSHVEPTNFQRSVTANSQLWVLSTSLTNTYTQLNPNFTYLGGT